MAERHRICCTCGTQFTYTISRGADRKYCTFRCAASASLARRVKTFGVCKVEGCQSLASRVGAQLCEAHFARLRRYGDTDLRGQPRSTWPCCQHCGRPSGGKKTCSPRCTARLARGCVKVAICAACGKDFEPVNRARTCSATCAVERKRRHERGYYATRIQTDERFADKIRAAEYRRKARKRQAHVEDVERIVVMERDGWQCHLCCQPIPRSARWPNPRFGTLDHVVPLSRGGAHSYANVRAAHLTCNCSKGNRIEPCHRDKTAREAKAAQRGAGGG